MVSRKSLNFFDLTFFRSESASIRTSKGRALASELVMLREDLPSEIALQGGSLENKIVYQGVSAYLDKPIKIFFGSQFKQGSMKR